MFKIYFLPEELFPGPALGSEGEEKPEMGPVTSEIAARWPNIMNLGLGMKA